MNRMACAALSSIGSQTCAVVVHFELHVFGLIPPLFKSNAILRWVATLNSPWIGKLWGNIAVAMLFSGKCYNLLLSG